MRPPVINVNKVKAYTLLIFSALLIVTCIEIGSAQENLFELGNMARTDADRVLFHPGLLTILRGMRLDTYATRLYGMKELELYSGFASFCAGKTRAGISLSSFGGNKYFETGLAMMFVHPLITYVDLSHEIRYFSVSIVGLEGKYDWSYSPGISFVHSRFIVGARAINLLSDGTASAGIAQNRSFQLMGELNITPVINIRMGTIKQENYPSIRQLESRMRFINAFTFIVTTGMNPSVYAVGAELEWRRLRFLYFVKNHSELGITSQVGFSYVRYPGNH